jgi:hypothetical protein
MIKAKIIKRGGVEASLSEFKKAKKAAFQDEIMWWHREIFPRHFTEVAKDLYGYKARTAEWNRRKMRLTGRAIPLVFTGNMQSQAEGSIKISGTSTGARGIMVGPQYLYMYQTGKVPGPNMADEMTRTTRKEVQIMGLHMDAAITADVKRNAMNIVETVNL